MILILLIVSLSLNLTLESIIYHLSHSLTLNDLSRGLSSMTLEVVQERQYLQLD